jgi:hypothetical protein
MANVSAELSLARKTIKSVSEAQLVPQLHGSIKDRKTLYDEYVYQYYLYEEMVDTDFNPAELDMIYFVTIDDVVFVYSRMKNLIADTVSYNYNVGGILPLHRSKCRIANKTIYTALYDKRLSFDPISPN